MKSWTRDVLHVGVEFVVLQENSNQHRTFRKWGRKEKFEYAGVSLLPKQCWSLRHLGISRGNARTGSVDTNASGQHFCLAIAIEL